jgi:deoxyribonuclease-4
MSEASPLSEPAEPTDTAPLPLPALSDSLASLSPLRPIGAHMPTAGGLHKSLLAGQQIGCTAVQLFTGSPRQWSHAPLEADAIATFHKVRDASDIRFTVAHDSYLINLAAPAADVLERSRVAFRGELDRAELLGIPWVVTHMGAHLNAGEEAAVARLVDSLTRILEETDKLGYKVGVALETTAGQGTGLGWRFEQIGEVLRGVGEHPRLGVCLDTCHIFVAGYDLRDDAAYARTWASFEAEIGRKNLKVIHANDAKKGLGSRVDRHEHIGGGEIGAAAFARLMLDPALAHVPIILETPDSETMHALNLARLNRLAAGTSLELAIEVQFFGHYSDYFDGQPVPVRLPYGASVSDLVQLLVRADARLEGIAQHCRFAVNEDYAALDAVLKEDCTVAVLPPMSGG